MLTVLLGHAEEGHHDGKICIHEWKAFFAWCTEHGEGEKYLSKAEKAAAKADISDTTAREQFDARVEALFKILDSDNSGELTMKEMKRVFGEETHDFWDDMDGEAWV